MPPDGYTTVTISDSLAEKLTRVMAQHDQPSYADAIRYAIDRILVSEDEITARELVRMLSERANELE